MNTNTRRIKNGAEWWPLPGGPHCVRYSTIQSKCVLPQAKATSKLILCTNNWAILLRIRVGDKYSMSSRHEYTLTESNPLGPTEMSSLGEQKGNPPEKWDCDQKLGRQKGISARAGEMWVGRGVSETCSRFQTLSVFLYKCKRFFFFGENLVLCSWETSSTDNFIMQIATEVLITEPVALHCTN